MVSISRFSNPEELPDLMAEGGRGLFLMSRLMDDLDLALQDGLRARMRLRGTRDPDVPSYRLVDLIDVPRLQGLLDSLHEAFGCPTAIVDNEARVLTATAWQDACTQFHRLDAETREQCEASDLHIYGQLGQGSDAVSYVCPRGMIDCAAPIRIEGRTSWERLHRPGVRRSSLTSKPTASKRGGSASRRRATSTLSRASPSSAAKTCERRLPFVRALAEMIAELGLARLREETG